jgi:hypothetical protein
MATRFRQTAAALNFHDVLSVNYLAKSLIQAAAKNARANCTTELVQELLLERE